MAAISHVFTVARVAEMLGENEDWLRHISTNMDPEEGHLWVIGVGEDGCPRLHRIRHRMPEADHHRRARAPRAQTRPEPVAPAVLTEGLR
jgi:hypothetical protein